MDKSWHFHQVCESDDLESTNTFCFPILPFMNHWPPCDIDGQEEHHIVDHAIDWIFSQQRSNGLWGEDPYTTQLSGLVISTMTFGGYSPQHERYGKQIEKALIALMEIEKEELDYAQQAGLIIGITEAADYYRIPILEDRVKTYLTGYAPDTNNLIEVEAAYTLFHYAERQNLTLSNRQAFIEATNISRQAATWLTPETTELWKTLPQPLFKRRQALWHWHDLGLSKSIEDAQYDRDMFRESIITRGRYCYWTPDSLSLSEKLMISGMTKRDKNLYVTALTLQILLTYFPPLNPYLKEWEMETEDRSKDIEAIAIPDESAP